MFCIADLSSTIPDSSINGLTGENVNYGLYADEAPIFTEFIDQRKYFETKNQVFTNLTKSFVTSEVIEKERT